VADALDETPRTERELAESVGAHPDALDRLPAAGCRVRASGGDRRPGWGLHPRGDAG
jgi:hypothetical protein